MERPRFSPKDIFKTTFQAGIAVSSALALQAGAPPVFAPQFEGKVNAQNNTSITQGTTGQAEKISTQPQPSLLEFTPSFGRWEGKATYYTREGCVGCREDKLMANGEPLDNRKRTIAFMLLPLETQVYIENLDTGRGTIARVTDRGNFHLHNILADVSEAVANEIGFNKSKGFAQVRITTMK